MTRIDQVLALVRVYIKAKAPGPWTDWDQVMLLELRECARALLATGRTPTCVAEMLIDAAEAA